MVALAADRPNIVLIMCDDLGWGDVGFNGNKVIRTPHLDTMAKQSLRFERFYAAAPVCSPTRGSCITGRHPYRYGVYFANTGHMKPENLRWRSYLKRMATQPAILANGIWARSQKPKRKPTEVVRAG